MQLNLLNLYFEKRLKMIPRLLVAPPSNQRGGRL